MLVIGRISGFLKTIESFRSTFGYLTWRETACGNEKTHRIAMGFYIYRDKSAAT